MPIYEYECPNCGRRFELRRGVRDSDNEVICPKCGSRQPRRVLSVFATGGSGEGCAPTGFT